MPDIRAKQPKPTKYVQKSTPESIALARKKEVINKNIAVIREAYVRLDKEYQQLVELQALLLASKYKIEEDKKRPISILLTDNRKSVDQKKPEDRQLEDKEVINKTKLDLKTDVLKLSFVEKEEEEDSE